MATYCALAALLCHCLLLAQLVSFDLNFYMLRNLHSIVSLALFLCCVFCILIRYVPLIVHYYPLFFCSTCYVTFVYLVLV